MPKLLAPVGAVMPQRSAAVSNLTSFLRHAVDRAAGLRDEKTAPFGPASHLARAPIKQGG